MTIFLFFVNFDNSRNLWILMYNINFIISNLKNPFVEFYFKHHIYNTSDLKNSCTHYNNFRKINKNWTHGFTASLLLSKHHKKIINLQWTLTPLTWRAWYCVVFICILNFAPRSLRSLRTKHYFTYIETVWNIISFSKKLHFPQLRLHGIEKNFKHKFFFDPFQDFLIDQDWIKTGRDCQTPPSPLPRLFWDSIRFLNKPDDVSLLIV